MLAVRRAVFTRDRRRRTARRTVHHARRLPDLAGAFAILRFSGRPLTFRHIEFNSDFAFAILLSFVTHCCRELVQVTHTQYYSTATSKSHKKRESRKKAERLCLADAVCHSSAYPLTIPSAGSSVTTPPAAVNCAISATRFAISASLATFFAVGSSM